MLSGLLAVPPTTGTFDSLLNLYLIFGIGAAVIVISLLAFFMYRYRYRGQKSPMPEHKVEGWKIVLVTVLISISVLTTAEYSTFASFNNIVIPNDASCVKQTNYPCVYIGVRAFQWGWNFTYPDGKFYLSTEGQSLTVPAGRIVVLNITSKDVFHSMGITMLAEKEDAIPGKTNQMWFMVPSPKVSTTPDVAAVDCNSSGASCTYVDAIRCFELCGVGHATMWGNLTVVDLPTWNAFVGGP
jgi:cytochrome c oxidase subunit II